MSRPNTIAALREERARMMKAVDAIDVVIDTLSHLGMAELTVQRRAPLTERLADAKQAPAPRRAAQPRDMADDDMSVDEAAAMLGKTKKAISVMKSPSVNQLRRGTKYGTVSRKSVLAYLELKKDMPGRARRGTAKKATSKRAQVWQPRDTQQGKDKMVLLEKVAKELQTDEVTLNRIKANGQVPGGNGWINYTVLQEYMASKEYQESEDRI